MNTPDIRSDLKAAGFNARRVTVRHTGCSIRVTIRDASVPLHAVATIANRYSSISRCAVTGEILAGGNTFVHVGYAAGVLTSLIAQVWARLQSAEEVAITAGGVYVVHPVSHGYGVWFRGPGCAGEHVGPSWAFASAGEASHEIARQIAARGQAVSAA